ncbi:MAG TPA: rhomboid family intramembrane serine protease [Methylomirabilota bacterium]|nr:rhomboid family intramembrane serine protease [Methylomirabilota bacterium]
MILLKDDVPTRSVPLLTLTLIAANVLVYAYEFFLWAGSVAGARMFAHLVHEFGLVPCRVGGTCPAALTTLLAGAPAPLLTVFTSMFLHAGVAHLAGNMLYLWVFGQSVEDALGRGRFLVFYLLGGGLAAAAQYQADPASAIPMVGASGAVSAVLGAYLLLHPHARVKILVIVGFFWRVVAVPALVVLGLWIVVQFVAGALSAGGGLGREESGGVAVLAHVGGFLAGILLLPLFRPRPRLGYARH